MWLVLKGQFLEVIYQNFALSVSVTHILRLHVSDLKVSEKTPVPRYVSDVSCERSLVRTLKVRFMRGDHYILCCALKKMRVNSTTV